MGVQLDRFSIALLILRPAAPVLDDEAGYLLAAGPLFDEEIRGLSILNVEPERALAEQDPAVQARRFSVKVMPWIVPRGAMSFSRTHFPLSVSEVQDQ